MSSKERAQRNAAQREQRFVVSAMEGMRQALNSPDGRSFVWWLYAENADAEGEGSKGRRQMAREVLRAARLADFEMLQIMREEHEKPRLGAHAEAEEPEDEE